MQDSTIIRVSDGQVSADVSGETVILDMARGTYFGLDPVGARIWSLIQDSSTFGTIITQLLQEYEVEPERCRRDVAALLDQMHTAGLIEIDDAPPA